MNITTLEENNNPKDNITQAMDFHLTMDTATTEIHHISIGHGGNRSFAQHLRDTTPEQFFELLDEQREISNLPPRCDEDDFFRPKLSKLQEHCTHWEITDHAKAKLFPLMLTGKATEYYTGEANFELFTGQWDELIFHKMAKENPDKSLEQNLSLLVEKLEKLFEGLCHDLYRQG
ncbi:hypothetical protein E4U16_003911, partial [Claviceps sp. LM84 group G4]